MVRGRELLLRDELLDGLRSHGKQSACELAARLGRNEKLVMRHLADLSDEGLIVCERLRELRCMKMRYWGFRSVQVRYYRLATAEDTRDVWAGNVWMRRWSDDPEAGKVC